MPVDLPGHGARADGASAAGVTLDAALAVVDEATRDCGQFDLVGYSMGGRIALHVALARPGRVRRLVLESASPGLPTEAERAGRRARDEALAGRIEQEGIEAFLEEWAGLPIFASRRALGPGPLDRLTEVQRKNRPHALAHALRGLGTGALSSLWDRLVDVSMPVLLVVGGLDRKFVEIASRMARGLPDVRVTEVPGVGHTVHLEAPERWTREVSAFLSGPPPDP